MALQSYSPGTGQLGHSWPCPDPGRPLRFLSGSVPALAAGTVSVIYYGDHTQHFQFLGCCTGARVDIISLYKYRDVRV
jgi:hypothetical protein